MPEHDIIQEEDGFVGCRCGATFSDNTTEEARARHRVHFQAETVHARGLAASRAALKGKGRDGS